MSVEQILRDIVSIDSVFPNEARLAEYIERYLKRLNFKVSRHHISKNRFNLLAEKGEGNRSILFYSHLDTVPVYGSWKHNAFTLTKEGDKLYGRGTCDMKGGVAAILSVLNNIGNKKIKLLFCVDEENISEGAWRAVRDKKGWFKDVYFVVSCEPGDSRKQTGGVNVVTLGRRGRAVFAIEVTGLASHGANPQRGINAIDEASTIVQHIGGFKLLHHKDLGSETIFVRSIEANSTSLSVPDKAYMELDMHLVPPSTIKNAKERVEDLLRYLHQNRKLNPKTRTVVIVKKRRTPYIEPYTDDKNSVLIRRLSRIVKKNFGSMVRNYGSSVADDNIITNTLKIPIVTIGPSGGNIHSENEWVSRRSLSQLAMLYQKIILDL